MNMNSLHCTKKGNTSNVTFWQQLHKCALKSAIYELYADIIILIF